MSLENRRRRLTDGDDNAHRGELEPVREPVEQHAKRRKEAEGEEEVPVGAVLGLVLLGDGYEGKISSES